ncbi:MAG: hypothetical protein QG583_647 [Patescibacteria group bacterium]|nr:hypothetical protein [Patescibacteria group bacterium]
MKKYIIIIVVLIILGVLFINAYNNKKVEQVSENTEMYSNEKEIENTNQVPDVKENNITNTNITNKEKIMYATLKTNMGDIKIEFLSLQAPKTVENFTKLAGENFYNGVKFHRVIKGFMIQGGDPLTKDDTKQSAWGTGGPGYKFEDEITDTNSNIIGTIAMANAGPNTNGSQFFINTANNNFLDTKHTVFGKVVSGMDVVTKIENTPTAPGDRPITPMVINSVVLE